MAVVEVSAPNPVEQVRRKFPDAFEDDTGEWVYIRVAEVVTGTCPSCGQKYARKECLKSGVVLGSAGNSEAAWQSAARNLGLAGE